MFKFNKYTIILSSGSLILLALGSLLLVSNAASSSDIHAPELENIAVTEALISSSTPSSEITNSDEIKTNQNQNLNPNSSPRDGRRRSGRLYGGQSSYGSQQQAPLDNYASAFANAPSNSDQSSNLVQSTVQANDASSFASFGELPSSSSAPSSGSSARQLASSDSYSPHSSYYTPGYISPSSSSTTYSGQSSNAGSSYHSPMHHSYSPQHYHKAAASSPPLGYPTNNYDRHSSYYDRNYLPSALAAPLWASSSPLGSTGLMSSASSALSHWTGGWGLGEIVCTLIAISIGAIILGAPFFLIYLALMGNFSGSGTLSLTNPTGITTAGGAATTVSNGRRKRLAIFEQLNSLSEISKQSSDFGKFIDSILHQINPLVDARQVTETFKRLTESMEKYSHQKPDSITKKSS